jgi:hypothetical protein
MAETDPHETDSSPDPPERFPSWVRQPVLMYLTMVVGFAICAIYVIHCVIAVSRAAK